MQMRRRLDEGNAERVPDIDHRLDQMSDMLCVWRGVGVMRSRSEPFATVG